MVSIIIPTYNREKTILRAINSVLEQTYNDIEVIIVDDGSKDNTREIIESLNCSKIRYIYQENGGASKARNTGIRAAEGEYISFQDSDDYWYPDKLEKQLAKLKEQKADVVFCKLRRCNYAEGSVWPKMDSGVVDYENLLRYPSVSTQTLFGKTFVFKENLFDETLPALEDYAFSIVVAEKYKMYLMEDVLVVLYLQDDSLTSDIRKYIDGNKAIMRNYEESIWKKYPKIKAARLYAIGCLESKIGINDYKIFKEAMQTDLKGKYIIKWLLARVGVLGTISKSNR